MNTNQPSFGNGHDAQIRSFTGPNVSDDFFGGSYPGLGTNSFSEVPQGGGFPVPYEGGGSLVGAGTSTSSNPFSGINFNQIKGLVDRLGGVDGIIGTMGKMQKFMASVQQMAPMLRVLFNSFGAGKVKAEELEAKRKRNRRRNRRGKSGKSTSTRRTRR